MKRMIAFQGADAKVGTTMVSQSVAELIASSRKDLKVFFAACNGKSGTEYFQTIGEWIENVRISLENRVVSKLELLENCRQTDNLYFLGGVGGILQDRRYRPEMVAYLAELLEDGVDLLIVDCGSEMDNALAAGAMEQAHDRYCILTQQESVLRRYEKLKKLYDRMNLSVSGYVLNKYLQDDPYTPSYIEKRLPLEAKPLYLVENIALGRRAEAERRTFLSYGRSDYAEEIRFIVNRILEEAELPVLNKQRKGLWKSSI